MQQCRPHVSAVTWLRYLRIPAGHFEGGGRRKQLWEGGVMGARALQAGSNGEGGGYA